MGRGRSRRDSIAVEIQVIHAHAEVPRGGVRQPFQHFDLAGIEGENVRSTGRPGLGHRGIRNGDLLPTARGHEIGTVVIVAGSGAAGGEARVLRLDMGLEAEGLACRALKHELDAVLGVVILGVAGHIQDLYVAVQIGGAGEVGRVVGHIARVGHGERAG
jgi:hypothetical protein